MKTTITETFDKTGKVVKRVTVTEDEQILTSPAYPAPIYPIYPPQPFPWNPTPNTGWPIITCETTTSVGPLTIN